MDAEQRARAKLDELLAAACWVVQDRTDLNLAASNGVAVRELSFSSGEPTPRSLSTARPPAPTTP